MTGCRVALWLCVSLIFVACSQEGEGRRDRTSGDVDAWELIRGGALLIDVRSPAEYRDGHIEGSINIPHVQVRARAEELGTDAGRAIVLYCSMGGRADMAKRDLESMGFTNVVNAGGYDALQSSR